jgi:hydroxyethylthiazole kinase-like uncharacterized protein yjeF
MKILSAEQIRELDQHTITNEPISSTDLMERAAAACTAHLKEILKPGSEIHIFCGPGNNGGDGLAISRMLAKDQFKVLTFLIRTNNNLSPDAEINLNKLKKEFPGSVNVIEIPEQLIAPGTNIVAIDALLGTGLNKAVEGLMAEMILHINKHYKSIISIDLPSGMFADQSSSENKTAIASTLCLTFQLPKLSFMMPGNESMLREFTLLDIGLSKKKIDDLPTHHYYLTSTDVASLVKPRNKFSHKGSYGHALLLAGSKGKSGAAVIAASACLKSGAGLLTVHSNADTCSAVINHLPEAMTEDDSHSDVITEINHPENFDAIGFGPGVGQEDDTALVLKKILHYYPGNLVIDADGINILAANKTWLSFLPPETILTPHPGEFARLTEKTNDDFERLKLLKEFSLKHNCIVVLKGAHSAIAMPDGNVFFNSTGNSGLAKGGSGDGLTGIILGLLARGYNAAQSALIGTFIHGFAADLCVEFKSKESLLITDVINRLPDAFFKIEEKTSFT